MNFSIEELYFMYGQYDTFVLLEFQLETKSRELFGKDGIMGRFRYTLDEKRDLKNTEVVTMYHVQKEHLNSSLLINIV